jgi:hypothetical protein
MKHGPTNTNKLKELKLSLKLSENQSKVLVGTVLGDGCLLLSRSGKAARLQIRQIRLSTYAFGRKGNLLLKDCLKQNFGLQTEIIKDSKGFYLYFLQDSAIKLYKLIKPYIIPCMEYKFVKVKTFITP